MPKQLLALAGPRTLLQDTWRRSCEAGATAAPIVVCNEMHRFVVRGQLSEEGAKPTVVLEPAGRNTAPAAAVAALLAAERDGADTMLLVLPSDHVVHDRAKFRDAVIAGTDAARGGALVTFGVVPDRPETGYGYIRAGAGAGAQPVEQFVEKPDLANARRFVESGRHFWNSGMFLFTAQAFLAELAAFAPDILDACRRAVTGAYEEDGLLRLDNAAFLASRSQSIDYAVMEKTSRAVVVPLNAGWSDVGSWDALRQVGPADGHGNVNSGDVIALDCHDSLIRAESRLVAALGLDGCIIVETKDAVLVVPAERAQEVRKLVDELSARGRPEVLHGREVFRPWGSYDSLESRPGFQVKRLAVLPGAVLSLQLHHRRAEHWVVVAGVARITRDDSIFDLRRNEYAFIPQGARHRIENPGSELLEIIEVQVGDYLGEDDIVRIEDRYGRQGRTD